MKNLYLFEINDVLADQAKLPYSTGLIWSYCLQNSDINKNYKLDGWYYYREDIDKIFNQIQDPSVIGFNTFVWNWHFNNRLAKKFKQKYPNCLIVYGGWQPPIADRSQDFFQEHPYVDIIVHGEGEECFKDILLENLKEAPDWHKILGCSIKMSLINKKYWNKKNIVKESLRLEAEVEIKNATPLSTYVTLPRPRIKDLASMPSPYLNGLFDELIKDCPYKLEATIETTRGCPYMCTFCEIGTKYYQRFRTPTLDKVLKEIDWLSDNEVIFVYNADSNFGLLPEHKDITSYLVKKKKETGFPDKHRCDWAKNKADKVLPLAQTFYEAEMDKGITIAVQSMNPAVLKAVKRKNVDNGKLSEFLKMYNQTELPSYMELILGLPEETLESFVDGICEIMELEQHNYIGIYALTALPNTPFGSKEYREKYNLEIRHTYPAFSHVDVSEHNDFEREEMIVSTSTMPHEDYKKCHIYRWLFMFGHYLGYVQYISRVFRQEYGVSYRDFYENILGYMENNPNSFIGSELKKTVDSLEGVMRCEAPWGRILEDVRKNYAWDFEEATAMRINQNKEQFYKEIKEIISNNYDVCDEVLQELVDFQRSAIVDPTTNYPIRHTTKYNFDDVLKNKVSIKKTRKTLEFSAKNFNGDYYAWGTEILWWGRRVAACKAKIKVIEKKQLKEKFEDVVMYG